MGSQSTAVITIICTWIFLVIGAVRSSALLGHYNYVLELAPVGKRPTYMGLFNTMSGILVLLPTLGGWLLEEASYSILFLITAVGLVMAHVLSMGLPFARRSVKAQVNPMS